MDEEEFDALMNLRPFGTEDAMHWYAQIRGDIGLGMTLGSALWGRTSEDLQRNCSRRILKYLQALIWLISGSCCNGPRK